MWLLPEGSSRPTAWWTMRRRERLCPPASRDVPRCGLTTPPRAARALSYVRCRARYSHHRQRSTSSYRRPARSHGESPATGGCSPVRATRCCCRSPIRRSGRSRPVLRLRSDPWGRLLRTLDYVNGTVYGGPALAGEIGRRVRDVHADQAACGPTASATRARAGGLRVGARHAGRGDRRRPRPLWQPAEHARERGSSGPNGAALGGWWACATVTCRRPGRTSGPTSTQWSPTAWSTPRPSTTCCERWAARSHRRSPIAPGRLAHPALADRGPVAPHHDRAAGAGVARALRPELVAGARGDLPCAGQRLAREHAAVACRRARVRPGLRPLAPAALQRGDVAAHVPGAHAAA